MWRHRQADTSSNPWCHSNPWPLSPSKQNHTALGRTVGTLPGRPILSTKRRCGCRFQSIQAGATPDSTQVVLEFQKPLMCADQSTLHFMMCSFSAIVLDWRSNFFLATSQQFEPDTYLELDRPPWGTNMTIREQFCSDYKLHSEGGVGGTQQGTIQMDYSLDMWKISILSISSLYKLTSYCY